MRWPCAGDPDRSTFNNWIMLKSLDGWPEERQAYWSGAGAGGAQSRMKSLAKFFSPLHWAA
jgi:hypothetical protein